LALIDQCIHFGFERGSVAVKTENIRVGNVGIGTKVKKVRIDGGKLVAKIWILIITHELFVNYIMLNY
jgi:hypothetical protein